MWINKKIVLLAALLSGCAAVPEKQALRRWQQEETPLRESVPGALDPDAGLADYVRYAQLHNPGLKKALARWQAALEEVAPARALADPRLTYGYFVRPVETRVGPQEMRLGAAQTFPWVGTLDLKGRVALQQAEVERQRYEVARQALVFRVKAAYYDYYYLGRVLAVTKDNLQLLAYLEEVGRARYRGGTGAHQAVLKAQVELGRLEDKLRSLREMQRPAAAQLNAALGRPATVPVAVPDALPVAAFSAGGLAARLQAANPTLRISQAQVAVAELAVELAGKKYYPELTLGVDYIRTGAARGIAPPDDSGKDPLVAMATIGLPIWRASYRAEERAAAARRQAARHAHRDLEIRLVAELEMAIYKRRDAESRTDLYRDSLLPKAEQVLNVTQQAFAAGRSDFLAVIDAQRALLEFQLAYERARTDQALYLAEIEKLVGETLVTEEDEQ